MDGFEALPVDFNQRHWGNKPVLVPFLLNEAVCTDEDVLRSCVVSLSASNLSR